MFSRKPSKVQSQTFTNSSVLGQVGQAGNDLVQMQQGNQLTESEKQLTIDEVVKLILQIEKMVQGSNLPSAIKDKAITYISATQAEVQEKEPDKEHAAKNLKRVTESLKNTGETVKEAKKLLDDIQPMLTKLADWFGVAKSFLGI